MLRIRTGFLKQPPHLGQSGIYLESEFSKAIAALPVSARQDPDFLTLNLPVDLLFRLGHWFDLDPVDDIS